MRTVLPGLTGKDERSKKWFTHGPVLAALLIISLFIPFFMPNEYYLRILVMILVYSILALALNLVTGFTGLLSFCQASFAGVGAYTTAILLNVTPRPHYLPQTTNREDWRGFRRGSQFGTLPRKDFLR